MTHIFEVTPLEFEALQSTQRHLVVKDSVKIATDDTVLIQTDDGHTGELIFKVITVEHGPGSKHINSHYCLLGLFAPYGSIDDIPATVG